MLLGKGRYSVKCQVEGNDDTQINEGFIVDRLINLLDHYIFASSLIKIVTVFFSNWGFKQSLSFPRSQTVIVISS